jgi:hypothetical protein
MENLAAYLIRSSFSQQRMEYLPHEAEVRYQSKEKEGHGETYHALEWLAAMPACACPHADRGTHVPERGQQCVRYYGYLSNSARGRRRKKDEHDPIPTVLEPEISSQQFRKNWARLIQKVFEVDPLVCSHCQGRLRVASFIDDPAVIRRILEHLGLCLPVRARTQTGLANARPIPEAHSPPVPHTPSDAFLFPVACVRGGRLLSNSPSPVGMLRRPLLLSAFRLMHPSAPISLSFLPLPPSRARRTPTAVLSGASSFPDSVCCA